MGGDNERGRERPRDRHADAASALAADQAVTQDEQDGSRRRVWIRVLKATAAAVKRGGGADLSRCDAKLAAAWAKLEAKSGASARLGDADGSPRRCGTMRARSWLP
jgi:hypothetical protein